jgi:GcrA cell cycle regulator
MHWDSERSDELRRYTAMGCSASQIATMMGQGITRNAVIGRLHRMGIRTAHAGGRPTNGSKNPGKKRSHKSKPPQTPAAREEIKAAAEIADCNIPLEQRRKFMELRAGECKWPVGDPKHPNFFFCGGPRKKGFPYCAVHCHMAFNVTPPLRINSVAKVA